MNIRPSERWRWATILVLPCLSAVLYLTWAWVRSGTAGYPLDDSWIHQVFARSLASRGEMTFNPGEPSAGSTAPLWTVLLAVGHWLGAPGPWSYLLGVTATAACGWLTWRLAERLLSNPEAVPGWNPEAVPGPVQPLAPWVATASILLEWHLAWAAVSGMETMLFIALSLGLVEAHLHAVPKPFRDSIRGVSPRAWLGLGLLGGLLCLTRPEGLLLVGLIGLDLLRTRRWGDALRFGLVCAATMAPGLVLNWSATGGLLPDTFAAKTIYSPDTGWSGRVIFMIQLPLTFVTGSLLLLLPAAVWGAWRALRTNWHQNWLPLAWSLGLVMLYTWWLPALYHHARYLMPVIPWVGLYGAAGLLSATNPWRREIPEPFRGEIPKPFWGRLLLALNGLVLLVTWLQGANTYAWNVDNIQDQQVTIGQWLARETSGGAAVAANDVGAVGYFGKHRIVDLEGLITPEVNRLRRAGSDLLPFLREQDVGYLVIYRDWKQPWPHAGRMTLTPVFTATLDLNTISATDQMIVYQVEWEALGN